MKTVHLLAKNSRGNWRPRCAIKQFTTITYDVSKATCLGCIKHHELGTFSDRSFTNVKADERRPRRPKEQ